MKTNVAGTSVERYKQLVAEGMDDRQKARILSKMEHGKGYTRGELSELTLLTINAVTGRVRELLDDGLLVEVEGEKRECSVSGFTAKVVRLAEKEPVAA